MGDLATPLYIAQGSPWHASGGLDWVHPMELLEYISTSLATLRPPGAQASHCQLMHSTMSVSLINPGGKTVLRGLGAEKALQPHKLVTQMPRCLSLATFPCNCRGYPILWACPTQAPMFNHAMHAGLPSTPNCHPHHQSPPLPVAPNAIPH